MKKIFYYTSILFILVGVFTGCNSSNADSQPTGTQEESTQTSGFSGEKGDFLPIDGESIQIVAVDVGDGNAHYYNTTLPNGNPVYFFVVKSPDGNFRAAANGCQVCGDALQGFHQEDDFMVCNTCGNKYPLNKIATEKGGCNPAPINPDLKVEDGNVEITLDQLKDIEQFFK